MVHTKCGIRNVSSSLSSATVIISTFRFHRIRERAVSLRHESDWRLYRAFCRPGHVRFCQHSFVKWGLIVDRSSFFQWQDILQVIIPRTSAMASASSKGESMSQEEGFTTCPICLAPPTAPRMTKCGHVRLEHPHLRLSLDCSRRYSVSRVFSISSGPRRTNGSAVLCASIP